MKVEIRALDPKDNRDTFSCGVAELDHYFQQYAGQNQFRHHIGTTYVAVTEDRVVVGYVTVSAVSLTNDDIGKRKLPNYPLPVLKIARLAVDNRFQGLGIGKALLRAMFLLALEQKKRVGCVGIVVDAKKEALSFYSALGFIELVPKDRKFYRNLSPLFLGIETIAQTR